MDLNRDSEECPDEFAKNCTACEMSNHFALTEFKWYQIQKQNKKHIFCEGDRQYNQLLCKCTFLRYYSKYHKHISN